MQQCPRLCLKHTPAPAVPLDAVKSVYVNTSKTVELCNTKARNGLSTLKIGGCLTPLRTLLLAFAGEEFTSLFSLLNEMPDGVRRSMRTTPLSGPDKRTLLHGILLFGTSSAFSLAVCDLSVVPIRFVTSIIFGGANTT